MSLADNERGEPRIYLLLMRLRTGGALVRAKDCSPEELTLAIADGRHTLDRDGYGYVWRLPPATDPR